MSASQRIVVQTQVEIFEQPADELEEVSSDALALIAELGLSGQQSLVSSQPDELETDADGQPKQTSTRTRWRQMTPHEMFVYSVLCPVVSEPARYNQSTIPVRVLEQIRDAKQSNFFDSLEIWDVRSSTIKDPVLVGRKRFKDTYETAFFILARWGSHLEELPALTKQALELFKAERSAKLRSIQQQVTVAVQELASITTISDVLQVHNRKRLTAPLFTHFEQLLILTQENILRQDLACEQALLTGLSPKEHPMTKKNNIHSWLPSFAIRPIMVGLVVQVPDSDDLDLSFTSTTGAREQANKIYNQLEPAAQQAVIDNLVSLQDQLGRIVAWYDERNRRSRC